MKNASTAVRLVALLAVALSPFAPSLELPSRQRSVVFVIDRSESVSPAALRRAEELVRQVWTNRGETGVGVVAFDFRPELIVPVDERLPEGAFAAPKEAVPGTDVSAALRLAAAALPQSGERRVVLLSDGRATRGDALADVHRLRASGVEVDVLATGESAPETTVLTAAAAVQDRVAEGEPVEVLAEVRGVPGAQALLRWSRGGTYVRTDWVTLDESGAGQSRLVDADARAGMHAYEVQLVDPDSAAPVQTRRALAVVSGRPRVLVVTTGGERPGLLMEALEEAETSVEVMTLGEEEIGEERLSGVDLVVLHDVPIAREGEVTLLAGISTEVQRRLVSWVRERGGGLLVTGGAFGFSPEYGAAPIARALPIEIEDLGEVEDPNVAMAVMLDRSGSMGMMVGSHTKLQLAIEAALAAASTLRPDDRVAIASVDTVTTWHQSLAPASDLLARRERIRAMALGGGGIYVYTALADAYAALAQAAEPIRHVILFSDSADSEEQFQGCPFMPCAGSLPSAVDLARTARMTGITTSVVGIGEPSDSDVTFLQDLAANGGGRYYLTSSGTDLRRIFVAETRATTRSNLVQGPIEVSLGDPHPALTGIDIGAAPPLDGMVQTNRRETADTALVDGEGRPVLASWRYGLGVVVALTTDAGGRWTDGWLEWEGAGQLLRQTVRFGMRRHAEAAADARVALGDRSVEVTVDVPDDAGAVPSTVELFALGSGGNAKAVEARLERVAPGRWVARGPVDGEPFAVARIRDAQGRLIAEAAGAQDSASELDALGPDERALGEIARAGGGVLGPDAAATLRPAAVSAPRPVVLWPWLLALAVALVAVDLWLRRLGPPRRRRLEPSGAADPAAIPTTAARG